MVTNYENQNRSCQYIKEKKKKKRTIQKSTSFYYNFSLGQSLGLLDCSLRGSLVCSFRVTLRRKWKSCRNNLHPMCLFVFSRILGSSQGLYGIRGHSLSHLSLFFVHPGLLGHFRRAAKGGKDLLKAAFLWISHLGRGVCLGATGGGGMNGLGVVDTF